NSILQACVSVGTVNPTASPPSFVPAVAPNHPDDGDLPIPIEWPTEWRLGLPNQVVTLPAAYTPVARDDRPDRYRCFILPNVVDQDRWIRAIDVLPGVRQMVHHVLLFLTDDPAQIQLAQQFEAEDPDPGYDSP